MFKLKYLFVILYIITISIFLYKSIQIIGIGSIDNISISSINNKILELTDNNFQNLIFYLFIFSFIWTLMLGFISPILFISGYLVSPVYAAIIVSFANALSGTILIYVIRRFYRTDIERFFNKKIFKVIEFINKDKDYYFLIFRIAGGFGVPSQLQNLLPSLTKIRLTNYFLISFFGCLPIFYVSTSIGYSIRFISDLSKINTGVFTNPKMIIFILFLILVLWVGKKMKSKFRN